MSRGALPVTSLHDPQGPGRLLGAVLSLAAVVWMMHLTEFDPAALVDPANQRTALHFAAGLFPPTHDAGFLRMMLQETWRTVAIATAGTVLAMLLALPAAVLVTRVLSLSALGGRATRKPWLPRAVRQGLRLLLVLLRSVPELVWALLLVRAVGLGPAAGVLAIAITYSGMLGKVYAEIFESADSAPTVALLHQGAGRVQGFLYGLLPQCSDELISYTVYRWECAIRSSVVLGFVGAGGLGQLIEQSIRMFAGGEVSALILVFILLVVLADATSALLRRAWA